MDETHEMDKTTTAKDNTHNNKKLKKTIENKQKKSKKLTIPLNLRRKESDRKSRWLGLYYTVFLSLSALKDVI